MIRSVIMPKTKHWCTLTLFFGMHKLSSLLLASKPSFHSIKTAAGTVLVADGFFASNSVNFSPIFKILFSTESL